MRESTSSLGATVHRTVGSIPSSSSLTAFIAGDEGESVVTRPVPVVDISFPFSHEISGNGFDSRATLFFQKSCAIARLNSLRSFSAGDEGIEPPP